MGTTVSVALISASTFIDMQAVSEKVRKASQRAYQGLVSYKVTISCSATSVFLPLRFLFSAHEPGQNAGWDVERPSFV